MRIRLFLARVMSTREFPTMERKKIVPYSGIIRFSRRLSWPDDCGMTGEVTLAIPEVTVENRGRPVTIDESSLASKASKYSVETGLSDRLRPWIDIFLSLELFDLSFPPFNSRQLMRPCRRKYSVTANVTSLWDITLWIGLYDIELIFLIVHCIHEYFTHYLMRL